MTRRPSALRRPARTGRSWAVAVVFAWGPEPVLPAEPDSASPAPPRFVVSIDARPRSAALVDRLAGAIPIETATGGEAIPVVELGDFDTAVAWVFAAAFAHVLPHEADALALVDAPIPGGGLRLGDEARVHAVVITPVASGGGDGPKLPRRGASGIAEAAHARTADLVIESAPLFAAPAAVLPPAAERHAIVPRTAEIWTLGHVDRCGGEGPTRRCLHWAQVVAQTDERFVFGYLPAMWLAARDGWVPGPVRRPRAQLVRSGRSGSDAQLVLLARDADGVLHRRLVTIPCVHDRWPRATLTVTGHTAAISIAGVPTITLSLDASLDARPEGL